MKPDLGRIFSATFSASASKFICVESSDLTWSRKISLFWSASKSNFLQWALPLSAKNLWTMKKIFKTKKSYTKRRFCSSTDFLRLWFVYSSSFLLLSSMSRSRSIRFLSSFFDFPRFFSSFASVLFLLLRSAWTLLKLSLEIKV